MDLFRRLERRLESLLDHAVAGVFRGQLHPTELAGRLAREADLAVVQLDTGPAAPSHYRLAVAPQDLGDDTPTEQLTRWLAAGVERLALERGWRIDGPATVQIVTDERVSRGNPTCTLGRVDGARDPWAMLHGETDVPVPVNRAVIGRGTGVDVPIDDDTVSRRHALLWTEGGLLYVRDLGSANGTWVDGDRVGDPPHEIPDAGRLTMGEASFIVRRR